MRFAILVGIVGGALDLGVGLLLLAGAAMPAAGSGMASAGAYAGGILVLTLGAAVLVTALYMGAAPMTAGRRALGPLMVVYGALMLLLAGAMLARQFPLMQGADLSGAAMIVVDLAMISSGATMRKR